MDLRATNKFRKGQTFNSRRRDGNASWPQSQRRYHKGRWGIATMMVCAVIVGVAGWLYLDRTSKFDMTVALARTPATDTPSALFSICDGGRRIDCVVDGDTFWFQGRTIRIADIDTPELSPPRCVAERVKGEAAKARLRTLLNAGKFSLAAGIKDEDQYGRKLRIVSRGGRSLGDILADEGLARSWDGARHGWCG